MKIMNPQQAQDLLAEIEQTQQRSTRMLGYWRRGAIVQLWGVVWMTAHLTIYCLPGHAGGIWMLCDALGIAGTILLSARGGAGRLDGRLAWAGCVVLAFGVLGSVLIGANARAISMSSGPVW